MPVLLLTLFVAAHLLWAMLSCSVETGNLLVDCLLQGLSVSALAMLAGVLLFGPRPAVRRVPVALLLATLWYVFRAHGDRLAMGGANHLHLLHESAIAIGILLPALLIGLLADHRLPHFVFRGQTGEQPNRFRLSELLLLFALVAIACVAIGYAERPYPYQDAQPADPAFDWFTWAPTTIGTELAFLLPIGVAAFTALPWGLASLHHLPLPKSLLIVAAGMAGMATATLIVQFFWLNLCVYPPIPTVLQFHYTAAAGYYIGGSIGVLLGGIYLRLAGFSFPQEQPESEDVQQDPSPAAARLGLAVLVVALLVMGVATSHLVDDWQQKYHDEKQRVTRGPLAER